MDKEIVGNDKHYDYLEYLMSNKRITINDLPRLLSRQYGISLRLAELIVDEWSDYLRQNGVD